MTRRADHADKAPTDPKAISSFAEFYPFSSVSETQVQTTSSHPDDRQDARPAPTPAHGEPAQAHR